MKERHDEELNILSQQLLNLQACMLRERQRVETLLQEKDAVITKQRVEIERLKAVVATSTTTTPTSASTGSESAASSSSSSQLFGGGSLRLHGSFRQYKKVRQQMKTAASTPSSNPTSAGSTSLVSTTGGLGDADGSTSSSSGVHVNSSDGDGESSSSPSTLPRSAAKPLLRQTVSSSIIECRGLSQPKGSSITNITNNNSSSINRGTMGKKGILKPCHSTGDFVSPTGRPTTEILDKLSKLIEPGTKSGSMRIKIGPALSTTTSMIRNSATTSSSSSTDSSPISVSKVKSAPAQQEAAKKTSLIEADKSDSGRESDENANVSVVTVSSSVSPTSSIRGPSETVKAKPSITTPKPTAASSEVVNNKRNKIGGRDRNSLSSTASSLSTDSANSSFDASDPTLAWKLNVSGPMATSNDQVQQPSKTLKPVKKAKPPPPPRSSQTKLSTSTPPTTAKTFKPKSILSPTSSLNNEMSPTEALDFLIHNNSLNGGSGVSSEKKSTKKVKFNPKVDTNTLTPLAPPTGSGSDPDQVVKPLDPNFLHFLPKLGSPSTFKEEPVVSDKTLINLEDDDSLNSSSNISYYEPYI